MNSPRSFSLSFVASLDNNLPAYCLVLVLVNIIHRYLPGTGI